MQHNASNYDFKRNMLSMLITAIVAVAVTIAVATALINNKLQPSVSAQRDNAVAQTAATTATAGPSCTTPSAVTAGADLGSVLGASTTLATVPEGGSGGQGGNTTPNTSTTTNNTSTTNHNTGNLVTVSDNSILNNLLNGNTVLSGNNTSALNGNTVNVSALNDVANVTDNTVNTAAALSNLVNATTGVAGVVGVLGL